MSTTTYRLDGRLLSIGETTPITDTFSKRKFVIETEEKYPQTIEFELFNDDTSKLDGKSIGTTLIVLFNIRGRQWADRRTGEVKYFNTLVCNGLKEYTTDYDPNFDSDTGSELPF